MRKMGILAVILVGSILSPYGFAQCSNGFGSRLVAVRRDRASYVALESGRWYPGKRRVQSRTFHNGTVVASLKESYPVPE